MCTVFVAYRVNPELPLIIAANRDEFCNRPTIKSNFNGPDNQILSGIDAQAGGRWMGINKNGYFAVLTNYRDLNNINENAPSRGVLVSKYLEKERTNESFERFLLDHSDDYNDFNLIYGDQNGYYCYESRTKKKILMKPGIYGLSNHLLDTPWPKVKTGKEKFKGITQLIHIEDMNYQLFDLLANRDKAGDDLLPDTGIGLEWERILSSIFIESENYGTRTSTILTIDNTGSVSWSEKTFTKGGTSSDIREYSFTINLS